MANQQVKCLHCGEVVAGITPRQFESCGCGAVKVDSGEQYLRLNIYPNTQYSRDLNAATVGARDNSNDQRECMFCGYIRLEVNMTPCGETFYCNLQSCLDAAQDLP